MHFVNLKMVGNKFGSEGKIFQNKHGYQNFFFISKSGNYLVVLEFTNLKNKKTVALAKFMSNL